MSIVFLNLLGNSNDLSFFIINNRDTTFDVYRDVVKAMDEAYVLVRNEYSKKVYGKDLSSLTETGYQQVLNEIPRRIPTGKGYLTYSCSRGGLWIL